MFRRFMLASVSVAGIACAATAQAQTAETTAEPAEVSGAAAPQQAPVEGATDSSYALEDIVITAQKRSERLQDVPIAVAALQASKLETSGISTTQNLQVAVPTLVFNSLAGYAQPFLRGIGTSVSIPNADTSVATYIDGAFVASIASGIVNLLGVDRVEVLSGPQGTLYGRNAVGGAVNIITLTPDQELRGQVSASIGNYDMRQGTAYVSGPIGDRLAVGIYGGASIRDTYMKRFRPAGPIPGEPDKEKSYGIRFKAVFDATDTLRFVGSVEHTYIRGIEGTAFRNISPNGLGFVLGAPLVIDKYTLANNEADFQQVRQTAATLRTTLDLDFAQLLSVTAYRKVTNKTQDDIDGTQATLLGQGSVLPEKHFSQELQLLSPESSRIKWIVGLYYFDDRSGYGPLYTMTPVLSPATPRNDVIDEVHTRSYAIFGQVTAPLDFVSPDLRLTVGGRYTVDRKSFEAIRTFSTTIGDFEDPGPIGAAPTVIYPRDKARWKEFTPKVTLDYRIGGTLLYATYSKGFKAGAYNTGTPELPGPVDPEKLTAWEVGSKSEFAGGTIRFNTAAFYYKLKDRQVSIIDFANANSTVLQNAASGEIYGLEANAVIALSREFQVTLSGAYLHSKYNDFPNFAASVPGAIGNDSVAIDATGNPFERTPKYTFSIAPSYSEEVGPGRLHADASLYFNSGYAWDASNFSRQPSYALVNASVGFAGPDDHWDVTAFVTNLTNTYYRNSYTPVSVFGTLVQDAPPRMYGLSFKYKL